MEEIFPLALSTSFLEAPYAGAAAREKKQEAFERMYRKSEEYGGLVSGEHGIGFAKREYLKHQLGEEQMGLMSGIKSVFDPKGILNPGKIV